MRRVPAVYEVCRVMEVKAQFIGVRGLMEVFDTCPGS